MKWDNNQVGISNFPTQSSGLLLAPVPVAILAGGVIWLIAGLLVRGGAKRFTRDQLAAKV